jgi:hypothetical protein
VAFGEQVDQQRPTAIEAVQLLEGLVVQGQQLAGARQQALTLGGEGDPAGGAGEQTHAELLLEPANVAAEGLLGHVQPCRGAGEVQLLGDRHKVAQQTRVQLIGHGCTSTRALIDTLGA